MFEVAQITSRTTIELFGIFESFIEAKAWVASQGVIYMEDDADHPDCADAFLSDGRVLSIQPVGFKLAS